MVNNEIITVKTTVSGGSVTEHVALAVSQVH
jgi:hypothetical protein